MTLKQNKIYTDGEYPIKILNIVNDVFVRIQVENRPPEVIKRSIIERCIIGEWPPKPKEIKITFGVG
ncbi:hypothetical protein KAR91_04030 [Candidatus Pacearchaeota archaeon]|nr:hypothetical protein [Candidatus Pacearchaeota archaeon]